QEVQKLNLQNAKVTAFSSTRKAGIAVEEDKNVQAVLESGVGAVALVGKTWDFHVENALRTTLEENLAMIEDTVAFMKERGLEVIFDGEHFFDGYAHNPAYALAALEAAVRGGANYLVLCDTNGGRLPHEVYKAVRDVVNRFDVPVGIHAHNDSGVAVANSLMAVEAGAVQVQGTVNGYGERCGNANLCTIIPNLQLKMGYEVITEEQLAGLTELSRYVSELANMEPDTKQPFVGKSVFAHKGGIHVSALLRHPETYEHIRPEMVGNRRRVLISELSGGANILYKAQEYNVDLGSDSQALRQMVETLKDLEHEGYSFEGAEGSFELLLKKSIGSYDPSFELKGFRLIIDKRSPNEEPIAEATIKLQVGDRILHTAAEGNGPVNALDMALRKALEEVYPSLRRMKLTDYKVRVINEKSGTEAKVRVLVETSDNGHSWGTVGVSTNIIEASWQALADSMEYGILKHNQEGNGV
ncbi:MAG: citramalate synthase, partial [Limnochordia bacterium]